MQTDKYLKNYIDGNLSPANSGNYLENINPSTGKAYNSLADSTAEDVQLAVEAAGRARPAWSSMDPQKRFRILMRIADIIEQNADVFARAETIDTGKPFTMSHSVDIPRAYNHFRFFATAMLHYPNQAFHLPKEASNYTRRQPIGIVGCIAPWYSPIHELSWKIAAALSMGNCIIAHIDERTPATAHLLSKACMEAKLPAGVLNIVFGKNEIIIPAIAQHPKIEAISYSGSLDMGQQIIQHSIPTIKKLQLVTGGKSPNIIFEDCNFDQMMIGTLRSSFSNNGQHPFACSRIYIEAGIYEKFKTELIKRTSFLKIGDPFSSITDLGALISESQFKSVQKYVESAVEDGGSLLYGGKMIDLPGEFKGGYFYRPAILEGLPIACKANQEEILGPVVTLTPFNNETDVIELANGTPFGLGASVWSEQISKAAKVAHQIKAGVVWLNGWMVQDMRAPFGGVKSSGLSKEGGQASMDFFSETQTISIKY